MSVFSSFMREYLVYLICDGSNHNLDRSATKTRGNAQEVLGNFSVPRKWSS